MNATPQTETKPKTVNDKRNPPAFQCYASDWIADEQYILATATERGVFFSLLNYCWANGNITAEPQQMAKLLGLVTEEAKALGALTKKHFAPLPSDGSRLHCPELERQKKEMNDRRERITDGGRNGGKKTQAQVRERTSSLPSRHPSSLAQASEMSRDEMKRDEQKSARKGKVIDHAWMDDYANGSNDDELTRPF